MSRYGEIAVEYARQATSRRGEEELTDAIGEGLAAIAYALVAIAETLEDNQRNS